MRYEQTMARATSFYPVIRAIFPGATASVESRERIQRRLNLQVYGNPRYGRLPQWAKMFLAGYIQRCFEDVFGPGDEAE
jgi:hypothetical protein